MPKPEDILIEALEKHHVTTVKNLLMEGINLQEIISLIPQLSENDVIQIIEQYKPARRWAMLSKSFEFKGLVSNNPIGDEMDYLPPQFDYLLELSKEVLEINRRN